MGCPHLHATGCGVYPRRHQVCADFRCEWLRDLGWPEVWRPDRSGLLCLREEIGAGITGAAVYEVRPGAMQEPAAVEVIAALKRNTAAIALVDSQEQRRCLLGQRFVHPAEPVPPGPHFLRRLNSHRNRPSPRAAAS